MRKNVGRPTIPAHKRKTRIHLSITPSLIEEIDNTRRWNESRSQFIVTAIKKSLDDEEDMLYFQDATVENHLAILFSKEVIGHDLFFALRDKFRDAEKLPDPRKK